MNGDNIVRAGDGKVTVTGELTFVTVPGVFDGGTAWLDGARGELTLDLKDVTRADSAGVALMLEWTRRARAAGREIRFVNLPEQVLHLIRVSGLMQAFGVKTS